MINNVADPNMKNKIIYLLLPLFLLSCSKKQSGVESQASVEPSLALPFEIVVVVTPETREQNEIKIQAKEFFKSRGYNKLDELAAKHRISKECYADGTWKLACIYEELSSPSQSDASAWEVHQKQIQDWIQARPESITARITMALFLRNYAWNARGSGYANTVTDKSWQLFGQRLNQAVVILNDAKSLNETCPVYWSTALGLGIGLQISKERFNDIFHQAIRAEPNYMFYYRTKAVFLLPRWHGEQGEWEKDLTQSADRIGGDDGDMLYAQVVWAIHHYGGFENIFDENKLLSWERTNRGFTIIEKHFPDSLAVKNERARLAVLAGDKENARKYFDQTGGNVDLSVWDSENTFVKFANWIYGQ